jgi:hypothetical protein
MQHQYTRKGECPVPYWSAFTPYTQLMNRPEGHGAYKQMVEITHMAWQTGAWISKEKISYQFVSILKRKISMQHQYRKGECSVPY